VPPVFRFPKAIDVIVKKIARVEIDAPIPSGPNTIGKIQLEGSSGNVAEVDSLGQLHTVMQGLADTNNSTTTPLSAAEVFTGTGTDILAYSAITVLVEADVAGTLAIQFSSNNTDWHDGEEYDIPASTAKFFTPPVQAQYYRIVYTNGGSDQTTFHLHSILKKQPIKWSSHNLQDSLNDQDDAELNISIPKLRTSANTYTSMQGTSSGNAKMSLEELESGVSVNSNTQLKVTNFDSSGNEIDYDNLNLEVPSTFANGKTTTNSGSAVVIKSDTTIRSVTVKALNSNTGLVYVGNSGVSSANGYELQAGESLDIDIDNTNKVYFDVSVNGEGVSYAYEV